MSTFILRRNSMNLNFNFRLNQDGKINSTDDGKLTPSVLYTTEAEESKKKTDDELAVPDPEKSEAEKIIKANTLEDKKD